MSFRDSVRALAAGTALAALGMAHLCGQAASADENAAEMPAMSTAPAKETASPDTCQWADQAGLPPPADADCTEFQVRLEQQAKRMDFQTKIMEQQAKRLELLAKIKVGKDMTEGNKAATSMPPNQRDLTTSNTVAPPPQNGKETDRVLEVFGEQARIRYRGGEILVRQGQTLPQGGSVSQVSIDGVVLVEGRSRRVLPFYIGEGEHK